MFKHQTPPAFNHKNFNAPNFKH